MNKFSKNITILLIIFLIQTTNAQSFGFGCFGFVGGYAGYSYQKYQPGYLNDQIIGFNNAISNGSVKIIPEFGTAQGYRLGINFFRARFSDFFFSLKGYYELTKEKHSYAYDNSGIETRSELNLDLKSWNIGLDFGIPITNNLQWKIIDGSIQFNSSRLSYKPNLDDNTKDIKFNNDSPELGYTVSTGFIITIFENFVSLEGTAGYRFLRIKKMTTEEGEPFLLRPENSRTIIENDFIKDGGFNAVLQLNIGFPL